MKKIYSYPLFLFTLSTIISCSKPEPTVELLTPDEFYSKLIETNDYQLLDVRTSDEVSTGIINNKVENFDFYAPDFNEKLQTLDKDKPTFVYCSGGVRSAETIDILQKNGFKELYDLKDGLDRWKKEGLKLSTQ